MFKNVSWEVLSVPFIFVILTASPEGKRGTILGAVCANSSMHLALTHTEREALNSTHTQVTDESHSHEQIKNLSKSKSQAHMAVVVAAAAAAMINTFIHAHCTRRRKVQLSVSG